VKRSRRPQLSDGFIQPANPDWAPEAKPRPRAARWQPTVAEWDNALVAIAKQGHPRVAWWWGEQRVGDVRGAVCYVCDRTIVEWPFTGAPPKAALSMVEDHRNTHYTQAREWMAKHG